MAERVQLSVDGAIARVLLARPEKRNGLDPAMFEALCACSEELRARRDIRAVVLSGAGPVFSAGLDFLAFAEAGPTAIERLLERGEAVANRAQQAVLGWRDLPMPVIAAIHGAALGGGMEIALGADLRYVTADAKLSLMEVKYGLIPDMATTQTLLRLVRDDVARELIFSARVLDGAEAVRLGLASRVCEDPLAAALETAGQIASRSPHAVRAAKRLLNEAPGLSPRAALALETALQRPLLGSPNQLEAVAAAFARRAPLFVDPE